MVSGLTTRMTTQRLARASRSRFFIGLGVLILTVGFVALFHSSQQELEQLRQMEQRCELQHQTLNQQLTAFEQSVKSERAEHQLTKIDLLRRTSEVKEFRDKTLMESNMKFGALQQSYKLLKIENDDLTDECGKLRSAHLEQLNALEQQAKNIGRQQELMGRQRERETEEFKLKIRQLQDKIASLETQLLAAKAGEKSTSADLQPLLLDYQAHCAWRPADHGGASVASVAHHPSTSSASGSASATATEVHNFNAQHRVSANLYVFSMDAGTTLQPPAQPDAAAAASAALNTNPLPGASQPLTTAAAAGKNTVTADGRMIINSVENFQIVPKPVPDTGSAQQPAALQAPTPSSTSPAAARVSKRARQIPAGVVPIPAQEMLVADADADADSPAPKAAAAAASSPNPPAASHENNRYANVMADDLGLGLGLAPGADPIVGDVPAIGDLAGAGEPDADAPNETDTGAHEVLDANEFLVDGHSLGHKDHMQLVLEDKQLGGASSQGVGADRGGSMGAAVGGGEANNAAEEEGAGAVVGGMMGGAGEKEENEEDNAILRRGAARGGGDDDGGRVGGLAGRGGGGGGGGAGGQARKVGASDPKLLNEIDADGGKVAGYQDDVHLEEALEEDGDDDDYANPAARNLEPAVRN